MPNSPMAPAIACGRLRPAMERTRTPTSVTPPGVRDASRSAQPALRRPGSLRLVAGWRRLSLPAQHPAPGDARSRLDGSPTALPSLAVRVPDRLHAADVLSVKRVVAGSAVAVALAGCSGGAEATPSADRLPVPAESHDLDCRRRTGGQRLRRQGGGGRPRHG